LHVRDVLLGLVLDEEVLLGGGVAINADFLVLFAGNVQLLVELGGFVVDLHELVETADFKGSFVNLDIVDG